MPELEERLKTERKALPEFKAPPLDEVVCGIYFETLRNWRTPHYGLFWANVKDEYPRFEDQMPLMEPPDRGKEVELELGPLPPLRRIWFVDRTDNYVLQIQPNRFLHNWRKRRGTDEYPRFEAAFARFKKYLEFFASFTKEAGIGELVPKQYELTYINHIFDRQSASPIALRLDQFVRFFTGIGSAANGRTHSHRIAHGVRASGGFWVAVCFYQTRASDI